MKTKLVRDKIPEIIKSEGRIPKYHEASKEEFREKVVEKLHEEVNEFSEDLSLDEFCDVLEVMDSIKKEMNFTDSDINKCRVDKAKKNGKFEKKYILEL